VQQASRLSAARPRALARPAITAAANVDALLGRRRSVRRRRMPAEWALQSTNPFVAKSISATPVSSVFPVTGTRAATVQSGDVLHNCIETDCRIHNVACGWFGVP
jgi:hypothetical protein